MAEKPGIHIPWEAYPWAACAMLNANGSLVLCSNTYVECEFGLWDFSVRQEGAKWHTVSSGHDLQGARAENCLWLRPEALGDED